VQIKLSTRHGNLSEATQEKIITKIEKLPRLFERLTSIEATVDLEHQEQPRIDLRVSAEHKHDFVASYVSEDLFGSVDQCVHKMEQQIRRYKEKIQDRHRPSTGHLSQTVTREEAE
jgi:putative sigma-54 modulation protein